MKEVETLNNDKEIVYFKNEAEVTISHAEKFNIQSICDIPPVVDFVGEMSKRIKAIKEKMDPIVSDAHRVHKSLTKMRGDLIDPYQKAKAIADSKASDFYLEQERIRMENQRKLEEKARREEAARQAELEAQAKRHEEKGRHDKAEERRQMAEETFIPAPIIQEAPKTIKGAGGASLSMAKDIEIHIINESEFKVAAMKDRGLLACLDINSAKLKRYCKDYGIFGREIPGIVIRSKFTARTRAST